MKKYEKQRFSQNSDKLLKRTQGQFVESRLEIRCDQIFSNNSYLFWLLICSTNVSFTLVTFVSKTFGNNDTWQSRDCTWLGQLALCDTDRIISVSVAPLKVAKASTSVSPSCVIVASVVALPLQIKDELLVDRIILSFVTSSTHLQSFSTGGSVERRRSRSGSSSGVENHFVQPRRKTGLWFGKILSRFEAFCSIYLNFVKSPVGTYFCKRTWQTKGSRENVHGYFRFF